MSYAGAVAALYLVKPAVLSSGYRATFLPTGILFLLFSLPCLIFIKDKPSAITVGFKSCLKKDRIRCIFRTLKATLFDRRQFPGSDFLKSAFFIFCAVNAVILFMSIYATRAFGLNEAEVVNLIIFSTLFAMAGSLFSGFISDYFGHKRALAVVFLLWGVCFWWGAFARDKHLYWVIGALAGVALGSTWTVTRAMAINIVPVEKIGEIFGLFNLVGYLSAMVGVLFWGVLIWFLSPLGELGYRITLLSLILFVSLGFIFLLRLPNNK